MIVLVILEPVTSAHDAVSTLPLRVTDPSARPLALKLRLAPVSHHAPVYELTRLDHDPTRYTITTSPVLSVPLKASATVYDATLAPVMLLPVMLCPVLSRAA